MRTKTFSAHNKPQNSHDVCRKRFNAHARILPSSCFSVASAFVPHLCFLSLLCFLSDFPIFPAPPVRTKTFSAHDKSKTNHDVRGKRFDTHAGMLTAPRFSVASAFVPHLCFLSLLSFFSDFPISPDSPVRNKTFSTHNRPQNNHDVCRKRFNAHARILPSSCFSVASAFVPHLCFLSLLCFLSDFTIFPDSPVRNKTFSIHNKSKNNHDVRRKRF